MLIKLTHFVKSNIIILIAPKQVYYSHFTACFNLFFAGQHTKLLVTLWTKPYLFIRLLRSKNSCKGKFKC